GRTVGSVGARAAAAPDPPAIPVHDRGPAARDRRPRRRARRRCASPSRTSPIALVSRIEDLIERRETVICCGSGGVGKTTAAAAMALAAARRGKRACVVTIDPAKRLADALGLESLTNK